MCSVLETIEDTSSRLLIKRLLLFPGVIWSGEDTGSET